MKHITKYFILLSFLISAATFFCLHAQENDEKPTLEQLANCRNVKISFECYRDEQNYDKESWQYIVETASTLVDSCKDTALTDAHFQQIYTTIDSIRNERATHPCPNIHGLVSVSVGEPSEKISYPENKQNLVWLGCKTTGYDPQKDTIQEIAIIITDPQLNIIAQSPIFKLVDSSLEQVESHILDFVKQYTQEKPALFGNDRITRHRALLKKYMPSLEAYFSTMTMNCFSMRQFFMLWGFDVYHRDETHSALEVAYQAIDEVRFYKEIYFNAAQ